MTGVAPHRADDGAPLEVVDVVGGAAGDALRDELIELHVENFPLHRFVADEIVVDAARDPRRTGVIVHQWLVRGGDGQALGYLLFDSNVARRVAIVHFIAVTRAGRDVRIGGRRLSAWLCHEALAALTRELAAEASPATPLGVFGESPEYKVRLWAGIGFRRIDVPYAEPEAGRHWTTDGDEMRPLCLLWLPPRDAEPATLEATAGPAGAAAFLLDHYRLPTTHPTVVATVGDEALRPGASGR